MSTKKERVRKQQDEDVLNKSIKINNDRLLSGLSEIKSLAEPNHYSKSPSTPNSCDMRDSEYDDEDFTPFKNSQTHNLSYPILSSDR